VSFLFRLVASAAFGLGFLAEFSPAPPRVPVFSRCVGRPLQRCFAGRLLLGSSSPGSKAGRACLISWGERRAEGAGWAVGAFGLITLLRQEGFGRWRHIVAQKTALTPIRKFFTFLSGARAWGREDLNARRSAVKKSCARGILPRGPSELTKG
jgi:hypothetical protein